LNIVLLAKFSGLKFNAISPAAVIVVDSAAAGAIAAKPIEQEMFCCLNQFYEHKCFYINFFILLAYNMANCKTHADFFEDNCDSCKQEYLELKTIHSNETPSNNYSNKEKSKNKIHMKKESNRKPKKYREFTELRAKILYEQLLLHYLKSSSSEVEAADKARNIIRKQCRIRKIPFWSWI
jgi:hypothetical protein